MAKFLVLHGPNLNLLGTREPEIYGTTTLQEINQRLVKTAEDAGHQLSTFQSNAEHALIDQIQHAREQKTDFIIINAAALTHSSVALRDALEAVAIPFIEVHISNIYQRETFRHKSFLSAIAKGVICGLGSIGYDLALQAAFEMIRKK